MTRPDPPAPEATKRRSDRANANFRNIELPPALRAVRAVLRACDLVSSATAARLALRMFLTPTHRMPKGEELATLERAESATVSIGGLTVHTYRWGDRERPTVLMSHGWDGHAGGFAAFVEPLLARGLAVLAFDGPAHGRSPGKQATLGQFADVVATLVERESKVEAVLGHSFGGAAAVIGLHKLAAAGHGRVERLVLLCPARRPDTALRQFADAFGLSARAMDGLRAGLAARHERELDYYSTDVLVRDLSVRGLVIHDEDDKVVVLSDGKAIADAMRDGQLVVTHGLGHLRILRDPAVVEQAVDVLAGAHR